MTARLKKLLRKDADRLARKRVLARGVCEAAGFDDVACNGSLQWAHIIRRRYLSVRWDDDAANCLCAAHHVYFTHHPLAEERFHIAYLGEENLQALKRRAESANGPPDYDAILDRLRSA
jgi:hypothetical protein